MSWTYQMGFCGIYLYSMSVGSLQLLSQLAHNGDSVNAPDGRNLWSIGRMVAHDGRMWMDGGGQASCTARWSDEISRYSKNSGISGTLCKSMLINNGVDGFEANHRHCAYRPDGSASASGDQHCQKHVSMSHVNPHKFQVLKNVCLSKRGAEE